MRLKEFIKKHNFHSAIVKGSSLKGCLVAKGEADVYIRFGSINDWDICAMSALIVESGGIITSLSGSPLLFNKKDTRVQGFASSNNTIHQSLIKMIQHE